jgi:hypothetical protein
MARAAMPAATRRYVARRDRVRRDAEPRDPDVRGALRALERRGAARRGRATGRSAALADARSDRHQLRTPSMWWRS